MLLGPEAPGFRLKPGEEPGVVTIIVYPGTPADRAGLKSGDLLLSFDGNRVKTESDIVAITANLVTGHTHILEVQRNGQYLQIAVSIERSRPAGRKAFIIWQVVSIFLLATALFIALKKPADRLALLGALALASLSVSMAWWFTLPWGGAAIWRNLPLPLGALLWLPRLASYLVGPIMLTFFALFPRPLFRRPWPVLLSWVPVLTLVPGYLLYTVNLVYWPSRALGQALKAGGPRLLGLYFLASLLAVTFNYFRLKDLNEKRKLRVLFIGGAIGVLPGVIRLVIWESKWPPGVFRWLASGWPDLFIAAVFILFPLSFAYSILKHRLLDIRLIIRQGIQYALTRGALLAIVPILAAGLAADMLIHGNQPFIQILKTRGWIYLLLAALAAGVHSQRQRWKRAIDRKFFREQYDAQQLLKELAVESARARSFASAAEIAVIRIAQALHPTFVSIMHRAGGHGIFQSLAVWPGEWTLPQMAAECSFVIKLRRDNRALDLTRIEAMSTGTVVEEKKDGEVLMEATRTMRSAGDERLTVYETEWLRQAKACLLVPISMNPQGNEALLVLGEKRSEEPYMEEDNELLEAVAANLLLSLERQGPSTGLTPEGFEECPKCGSCWETGSTSCQYDGAVLNPVPLPRTMAGRYHLERRRGGGGMGTVYEARDIALGRRVAVKVMREEFVYSPAAARRFEQEARATAAFDHPNVVTVYDYGVEGGVHAFLVMELLEGETLRQRLYARGRLEPSLVIHIFRQVCQAVDTAHRHKLIHRDLKPENIHLCPDVEGLSPRVKLLDFGVAKFLDPGEESDQPGNMLITESGVLVGTLAYMSPEQLLGGKPSISWDLWALAVTAYEALTGGLPFPVEDRENWRRSILAGCCVPLSQHLPGVAPGWEEFFARALAVDRGWRPGTAAELFQQLELAIG
ncbi:MAG: protein kinase [Candidatus Aminicenantes bacterium]|nr:protein kinase [Candidatus Aminicenantes bacterium]